MPLLWLSLAFLCGVTAGWLLKSPVPAWVFLAAGSSAVLLLLCHVAARSHRFSSLAIERLFNRWPADRERLLPGFILPLLPIFFILGTLRFRATVPEVDPSQLAWYNDREERLVVEGVISTDPEFRDAYTLLHMTADHLRLADAAVSIPVEGNLLARLPPGGDWRYGDRIRLDGRLRTPSEVGDFSYREYLEHQGILSTLSCGYCQDCSEPLARECAWLVGRDEGSWFLRNVFALRRAALQVIDDLFPDPEAGLLAGILLGIETGIPDDLLQAFRQTGVSHIIAISGFNFAIVAGLFVLAFDRVLGRWKSLPAAWVGIGLYALLAGATPGVIRAAFMGSLAVFAVRLGRRSSGVNTLLFVAMVMAVLNPHVLWDVGFQLSFMATLGLILYADPLERNFKELARRWLTPDAAGKVAGPVSAYLLFTLAAQVTTLPLILYVFKQTSPISLIANPLVLPAQPPLMVLGGLAAMVGLISRPFGQLGAYFAWPWIAYTIRIVELLAETRIAAWTIGGIGFAVMIGFYVLLFGLTLWGGRLREFVSRKIDLSAPRLGWGLNLGLALLAVVVWQRVFALPDGRLHLTALDVGGGEALLIQTPEGRSMLVNGGPSPNALAEAIGRRMPIGSREIDYLIVGGAGEQQIAGLPRGLDRFQVRKVLWAGPKAGDYSARELQRRLAEDAIPVSEAQPGQAFELGEGASLEVVAVTRRGAVFLLEWKNFRALLPVGMDFESQEALLRDPRLRPVTALLLAEGGFATLNSPEWIAHFQPQLALLSVEAGNAQGLPHPETLAALGEIPLLRTDMNGWIEVSTDGERLWVEVERKLEE